MDTPRLGWRAGQPVVLDLFDMPHTAADLERAVRALETQRAAVTDSEHVLDAAIAQRRAWLADLARAEASHAA